MRQIKETQQQIINTDSLAPSSHPLHLPRYSPPLFGLAAAAAAAANRGQLEASSDDQPLDFSASKKIKLEIHDSLGSDGHSDLLSISHSPGSVETDSPRAAVTAAAGVGSADISAANSSSGVSSCGGGGGGSLTQSLPRLSITPPSSLHNPTADLSPPLLDTKQGLLTTVPPPHHSTPLLRPPQTHDMTGLMKLAGIAGSMPHLHNNSPVLPGAGLPPTMPGLAGLPFLPYHKPSFTQQHPPLSITPPPPAATLPGFPTAGGQPAESMAELVKLTANSNQKYAEFREGMLQTMNAGAATGGNSRSKSAAAGRHNSDLNSSCDSPKLTSTPNGGEKDEAYWERRRKNNEAAKRSRDARRQKENEIAIKAQFLEQENIQLKMELVQLRTEKATLREQVNRLQVSAN